MTTGASSVGQKKLVSVVIPAFNRPKMLLEAVNSVLAQTFKNFELIVVDDGSTADLSRVGELVERAGQRYLKTKNQGPGAARNFGAKVSLGHWLAFLDSDDRWLKRKLERQLKFVDAHPECRLCQCEEIWFRNGARVNPKSHHLMPDGEAFYQSLKICCVSASAIIIERELFLELGGFDERLRACEDYDFWIRLARKHQIRLIREGLVEKFGGRSDQVSRSLKVMDRFRVFSLVNIVLTEELSPPQLKASLEEVQRKAGYIAAGAKKRGHEFGLVFSSLGEEAAKLLQQGSEQIEVSKVLGRFFPFLTEFIQPGKSSKWETVKL